MKYITSLLLLCSCLIVFSLSAQNEIELSELLDRFSQNHMGSIDDVFSSEELLVLQEHFSEINTDQQEANFLINRQYSSTKGNTPVSVVTLDPADLTVDIHGLSPLTEFEGAGVARFSPTENVYIIDNVNRIYIRGVAATSYTDNGVISNIPPGESITGAEYLSNGDLMIISTNGMNSSHIFMLDPVMAEATPIGGNNGLIVPINLVRDGSDNLFTLDIDDDMVYGIDKVTGVASPIGPAGFDANFGQGGAYDIITGEVLLTAFNGTIGDSELRMMNPATGLTTSLGTITPGTIDQFGWVGPYDADLLGVNDQSFNDFSFYPNPANEILSVNAKTTIELLTIYNLTGQKVLEESFSATTGEVKITHLDSGLYILKVQLEGKTASYKFVKE